MQTTIQIPLDTFTPVSDLVIVYKGQLAFIPFDTIQRVRKKGSQVSIFTGHDKFICYHSMEEIYRELPVNLFVRMSKSSIIRMEHLHHLGDRTRITRYYKKELSEKLGAILEQHYRWMSMR